VPPAAAAFARLPTSYANATQELAELQSTPLRRLEMTRRWADTARLNYREARQLAVEGR